MLARLYWRGGKAAAYRKRWQERLGFYPAQGNVSDVIWFHAVSVGEFEAAVPLIRRCLTDFPDHLLLITTTTPTGSSRVTDVFGNHVSHVYLPYDVPCVIARFINFFQPKLAVFLEKELWPNLFFALHREAIPIVIVNGRLSERSARYYRFIEPLIAPTLDCVSDICVQTDDDRRCFTSIGAGSSRLHVFGNIKFDMTIDDKTLEAGERIKGKLFSNRFVWILASTHDGEEVQLISVFKEIKSSIPEALLLIAPRHPERFEDVRRLCQEEGFKVALRSTNDGVSSETDIYIIDSIGELKMFYKAADVAFVGGSLVPVGGHNVIEPALIGVPIIFGPHMFNFQDVANQLIRRSAAVRVSGQMDVKRSLLRMYKDLDYRHGLISEAYACVKDNQGAVDRTMSIIKAYMQR